MLNELMRTAEGKDRIDRDEDMRQDKRARVEMDTGDGHHKPAEAKNEDEQIEETRGNGQIEQSLHKCSSRKNDEASGTVEKGERSSTVGAAVQRPLRDRTAMLEVQTQSQTKYRWTHRTEKSARTKGKDQGAHTQRQ